VLLAALGLLLGALALPGCADCGREPLARLVAPAGDVQWRHEGAWEPAEDQVGLELGDAVRTGAKARAAVVFRGGAKVTVAPQSLLELVDEGGQLVIRLAEGAMDVAGQGQQLRLSLGKSTRVLSLDGTVRVRREIQGVGLNLVLGSGSLEGADGEAVPIQEGSGLQLVMAKDGRMEIVGKGLTLNLGGSDEAAGGQDAGVTPPAVADAVAGEEPDAGPDAGPDVGQDAGGDAGQDTEADAAPDVGSDAGAAADQGPDGGSAPVVGAATLVDAKRRTRIQGPDEARAHRPRAKRTPLAPGTHLVAGAGAQIEGASGTRFKLGKRAKLVWKGSGALRLGAGDVRAVVRDGVARIGTALATVDVMATGLQGNTQVVVKRGETRVAVRFGKAVATVGERKISVGAGQVLVIKPGGQVQGPSSAGRAPLVVGEGKRVRIYYDRAPSRLTLAWEGGGGTLEVARSDSFAEPLIREPVTGNFFTLTAPSGRLYWRVIRGGAPGPTGRVSLSRDPAVGRGSGGVHNVVRDTGRETRIYFQGAHPALTFVWKPVDGAAFYRLRLFTENNLDSPRVNRKVDKPKAVLPAGRLKEGTYYWYQAAYDEAGKELATSQMNKLSLTFDNKLPALRIDSIRGGVATGVVAKGASVTVAGRRLTVGPGGRFKQKVSRERGLYIFRLRRGADSELLFIRR